MDNNADDLALVEKTIETIKDIATSITANSAIGPKPDPEQVAGTTNEQLHVPPSEPELAIAPQTQMEDVVAVAAPKKKRKAPVRQAPPKKSAAKKSSKKVAKKSAKKTKSSAGRKAVGKKNKTAKKVAKKKKTKKSKR